ncbi:AAA family ATPase [Catenuloplanes atrovinosus]|uniref:ATPase n=1 Tax=Catenuloplanes atrovinosus TaxID=137266 RepID=A0AAE3YN00_9ACTN|nr:AAA family ATPase [Catenuloplanes atrovinosus]MDR7275163.1 putative ATPase [Catenuloplanes atrovinosus]
MIRTLAIEGYRSLRDLTVELGPLTVVTGANGSGKSSLYRALRLLAGAARNGTVAALAREGGLARTRWAGPPARSGPVAIRLGFSGDDYGYAIDLGLPPPSRTSKFGNDPEIKREALWSGPLLRPSMLLADRDGPLISIRNGRGRLEPALEAVSPFDSMLSEYADAPLIKLRERIRRWRFYDHLRTDADAPARRATIGTRTPILGHDGADLAAALRTIVEIGDHDALDAAIDAGFPGSRIEIAVDEEDGVMRLALRQPGLERPLGAAELSDGTLRYLLWAAALLTPRPPELLVLNEPETSLHPDLLGPLAGLIATAAARGQVVVVTHSAALTAALDADAHTIELVKEEGETRVAGLGRFEGPAWKWPTR